MDQIQCLFCGEFKRRGNFAPGTLTSWDKGTLDPSRQKCLFCHEKEKEEEEKKGQEISIEDVPFRNKILLRGDWYVSQTEACKMLSWISGGNITKKLRDAGISFYQLHDDSDKKRKKNPIFWKFEGAKSIKELKKRIEVPQRNNDSKATFESESESRPTAPTAMEIDSLKKTIFNKLEEQEREISKAIEMLKEIKDVVKKLDNAWEVFTAPTVGQCGDFSVTP